MSTAGYVAEFPALLAELGADRLTVNARAVPLVDVEAAWTAPAAFAERVVLTPGS